jgi:hypothetical protein
VQELFKDEDEAQVGHRPRPPPLLGPIGQCTCIVYVARAYWQRYTCELPALYTCIVHVAHV